MKHAIILLICFVMSAAVHSSSDTACQEACVRQGGEWNYCAGACGRQEPHRRQPPIEQPGLQRNPAFDQLERETKPSDRSLPPVVDKKCVQDCRAKGYNYQLCARQCSY